jgi:glutamine cyclotransferase
VKKRRAEIVREYGPFPGIERVHGVTHDGQRVWFASGEKMHALDPESGALVGAIETPCDAGTAFDGKHFFQLAGEQINVVDPKTGRITRSIPAPGSGNAGLAWAEGSLWLAKYEERKILRIDPVTGAILKTIESDRFVTGVSFVEGEMWHGTWENEESEIRRVDPESGEVLVRLELPEGTGVTGLESDGGELFYAGGGSSGTVRAIRRR